ncbi:MAG: glycogen debranching protein GlgX [Bacteroidetes bacterium]|nr:glycogen debranching protein GlgX [Bacteroidota bacterium]
MSKRNARTSSPPPFIGDDYEFTRGHPLPFGASLFRDGVNFSVYARHATDVSLVLINPVTNVEVYEFRLEPDDNKTGDVWHCFLKDLDPSVCYGWRIDRNPNIRPHIHRYDPENILIDPYAKALSGGHVWNRYPHKDRYSLIVDDEFDWKNDKPLNIPLVDSVIYEVHLRGFTAHPSSRVTNRGTFKGMIQKIPYLKDLGITAVELLPVNEFEEMEGSDRRNPVTGQPLMNFWGYNPISFFAPKASYAASGANGGQVTEFKEMVKAFHKAGIEVILDVVFNHTAEGNEYGESLSFRGIDNQTYYIIDQVTGKYHNYSGCGNTLNCNHPFVRDFIIDCLKYWVTEMRVDGFRFDLASILGRDQDGTVLNNPPLLERIAADPVLSKTKIIAEAWDAAGLYQVGSFPHWQRWAEWNGKFRDDVRKFVKGDPGMAGIISRRITGSADLYEHSGRAPYDSINFVTCHDGFTLMDLVSFNEKHNEANGENQADGSNDNFSWNCGAEGPTDSEEITQLRIRQVKNFAAILLSSFGVPMILSGDEMGRTQQGNNNAYCHDNEISWLNWQLLNRNSEIFRFFKRLIAFRKANPILKREKFSEFDLTWHGFKLFEPDWSDSARWISVHISSSRFPEMTGVKHLQVILNAHWENHSFELPRLVGKEWYLFLDTHLPSPFDISDEGKEILLYNQENYEAKARSCVILIGK